MERLYRWGGLILTQNRRQTFDLNRHRKLTKSWVDRIDNHSIWPLSFNYTRPFFRPRLSTSFPCSALYRCWGVRRMSPSNRLVSLLFRFSAKQSDQCRGPVRGFLLSLIPVTLRTDIPKRSKTVSTLKVRDRAGGGNGGEGGNLPSSRILCAK